MKKICKYCKYWDHAGRCIGHEEVLQKNRNWYYFPDMGHCTGSDYGCESYVETTITQQEKI
jgi:hypothetical protein